MLRQLWQRLVRIVAGNDNPLQRHVDRVESTIVTGLIVAFFLAAPLLSVFTVRATAAAARQELRAEAGWRQRTAILQESGAAGLIAEDGIFETSWVTARWQAPDGTERKGLVAVDLNAPAGQRVTVWVTQTGLLEHQPLSRGEVLEWETTSAMLTLISLALLLVVAGCTVRVVANRRRMAGWAQAWAVTGPRWSSLR
ncbi:MAG TPA: hypothetical protein VMB74_11645 [Streptosporangiaceae bacterium]|nr:hypothetical protein [Streptosporangiaceae bacterium]